MTSVVTELNSTGSTVRIDKVTYIITTRKELLQKYEVFNKEEMEYQKIPS
jgi:hypothetical protein